ncbi:MAG: SIMPL domain-containing protein [Candidatus Eremiobacteraeota bacterium]|nr:SIMPL domain-containing protein [Candidatus Eremiobacteraeota bacterium]
MSLLKFLSLLALLSLGSGIAAAQTADPRSVNGGIPASAGGVTVVGHGSVVISPDRARVEVRLVPQRFSGASLSIDDSGKTVANALRTAGVADASYELPVEGMLGPNSQPAVTGTVTKPTRESLERIARATVKALPSSLPGVQTFSIGIAYFIDDCSAAESRAQSAALDDARARAKRVATAADVHLGPILAVNEAATFPSPACGQTAPNFGQNIFNNQDAYGPLVVTIAVTATVTFAIR